MNSQHLLAWFPSEWMWFADELINWNMLYWIMIQATVLCCLLNGSTNHRCQQLLACRIILATCAQPVFSTLNYARQRNYDRGPEIRNLLLVSMHLLACNHGLKLWTFWCFHIGGGEDDDDDDEHYYTCLGPSGGLCTHVTAVIMRRLDDWS